MISPICCSSFLFVVRLYALPRKSTAPSLSLSSRWNDPGTYYLLEIHYRDRLGIYSRKHEPLSPKVELRFRLVHNYSPLETKLLQKSGLARNKICFFTKK